MWACGQPGGCTVWPLGTFAWCVRSARTAPFRTRSLRAAFTNEPIIRRVKTRMVSNRLAN